LSLENISQVEETFSKKYIQFWNTSIEKKGYSGVCTLTKFKPLAMTLGINKKPHDNEGNYLFIKGRVLTLEYEKFYLINIYVPNSGEVFLILIRCLRGWIIGLKNGSQVLEGM
jgi:exodeoxyribonuclease-3